MTNWLESEEKKKEEEVRKKLFDLNKELILNDERKEKEDLLHNNLQAFYNLCNRVNRVGKNSIHIFQNSIYVEKLLKNIRGYRSLNERRKISFSITDSDQIHIDILQCQFFINHLLPNSKFVNNIVKEKKCSNKDIIDWPEEKILNIIRWLISECDFSDEDLPGEKQVLINESNWIFDWIWYHLKKLNG